MKVPTKTRQTQPGQTRNARERRQRRPLLRQHGQRLRDAREHRGIAKMGLAHSNAARHEGHVAASQPAATDPATSTTTVTMRRILRRVRAPLTPAIRSAQLQNALLVEGYGTQGTTLEPHLATQAILHLIERAALRSRFFDEFQ